MDDRRRFPRWTISNRVFYKREGEEEERVALSKDICSNGACISLSEAVTPNTELDLKIHLGNNLEPISAKGRVVWLYPSREAKDNPFLAGVHFDYLRESEKDKIYNYAYQFRREELQKRWWQGV
jgi:c-di-GMP-binding flagellar brake protein YcgR